MNKATLLAILACLPPPASFVLVFWLYVVGAFHSYNPALLFSCLFWFWIILYAIVALIGVRRRLSKL